MADCTDVIKDTLVHVRLNGDVTVTNHVQNVIVKLKPSLALKYVGANGP